MEKTIIYFGIDENQYKYTEIQVTEISNSEMHKAARKEIADITVQNKSSCTINPFFLIDADTDSFSMKIWGNAVNQLEEIGYTF